MKMRTEIAAGVAAAIMISLGADLLMFPLALLKSKPQILPLYLATIKMQSHPQ